MSFNARQALALTTLAAALAAPTAQAETLTVTITNLTAGISFTPVLVAAHGPTTDLFEVGEAASANLQAMAEGGAIDGLDTDVRNAGGSTAANPAGGLLGPGQSTNATLSAVDINSLSQLSVVAMMLPTNDGFIGLDAIDIPASGEHRYNLNAYDAGTEANAELIVAGAGMPGQAGIPADPSGMGGTGGSGVATGGPASVHIHPGVLGDTDAAGGASDLDSRVHRWLNPVARVTLSVTQ